VDYHFSLNSYGKPVAKFSMDHESIGRWFTDELGSNMQRIASLIENVERLEKRILFEKEYLGMELRLALNHSDIEVSALALDFDFDGDLPEETELYDTESHSGCGLPDFKQALLAWQEFINL
jgi:uncharacterized protein YacL (UPF0231 family)